MNPSNSTFSLANDSDNQRELEGMRSDGSHLENVSPPAYVTFRKGMSQSGDKFREEFASFRDTILTMLESWFSKHDEKCAKLISEFESVKTAIQFMSDKYEVIEKKTQEVADRVLELERKFESSQSLGLRVATLEAKLEDMEQKSRNCNVEISNLPEKRGENLLNIVENIASVIKQPLSSRDIVAVHRVPQMQPNSNRPKNIVVKFVSQLLRDNFVAATRLNKGLKTDDIKMHGCSQNIYINEHLTLKSKLLFRKTKEIAKQSGFKFIWIKHGIILVRKDVSTAAFAIRTESDLSRLAMDV